MIGSIALYALLEAQSQPSGAYVEARTASVYAGSCHYGGEATVAGREAVLAWSFTSGSYADVRLAGMSLVALVVGDRNLADANVHRSSFVYVPESATAAQRDAALAWLRDTRADLVGDIARVDVVALTAN